MRGASNYSFRPQQGNSFYGSNQPGQQIPRGFCFGFHTRAPDVSIGANVNLTTNVSCASHKNHTLRTTATNQGVELGIVPKHTEQGSHFMGSLHLRNPHHFQKGSNLTHNIPSTLPTPANQREFENLLSPSCLEHYNSTKKNSKALKNMKLMVLSFEARLNG